MEYITEKKLNVNTIPINNTMIFFLSGEIPLVEI
jgi:hypothetical protein